MNLIKLTVLGLFLLLNTPYLSAQIVINEVVPLSGGNSMIELRNNGNTTMDISTWILCSVANGANYNVINTLSVVSGSTSSFAPGSLLVLTGISLQDQDELALYTSSPFTSSANIRAYLRWGNPGVGRSMVAQGANLWTVGNSVTAGALPAANSIQYDGDGQTGERGYNPTSSPTIGAANTCALGTPDGGNVWLMDNTDTISGVANTGTFDFYVKNTGTSDTFSYWYIITTEQDSILGWVNANMMRDSALMTINAPAGTCHIWGWSYKGLANPVMGEHISTLNDNVCEEISANWITVVRQVPDGGNVWLMDNTDTISGVANTGTFQFYVKNTGTADQLSYWYIITTEQDSILGWVNANTMRDSALMTINAPAGTCHIWGWSYKGLPNPVMGAHISTLDDDPREDISANWITVVRQVPDGGNVWLMDNTDTISGVANTGTFQFYVKNTGTADQLSYWYIITTEQDSILGWVNANTMRDSALMTINAPAGTCHIWGWSYKGLPNPVMGAHISTLDDDPREDISANWITVVRQVPDGGNVWLMDNTDTISGVANTGTFQFYVKNTGTADQLSYWYIITTEQDSILGWVNANTMRDSALMTINAPAGTCHIWGWSYKGLPNPVMGAHISTLDDDPREDISANWITVVRQVPDGGNVWLMNNTDTITGLANSSSFDFYVKNTGTADQLSYWYIITTEQDSILGWVNANTMRDSALMTINAPAGTCHIWGWSYKGLSDPIMGAHISTLDDDPREDISANWITVVRTVASSFEKVETALDINVYPNPATTVVYIEGAEIDWVRVLDLNGRVIQETSEKTVDVSTLNTGVYLLDVVDSTGKRKVTKFVKQ